MAYSTREQSAWPSDCDTRNGLAEVLRSPSRVSSTWLAVVVAHSDVVDRFCSPDLVGHNRCCMSVVVDEALEVSSPWEGLVVVELVPLYHSKQETGSDNQGA